MGQSERSRQGSGFPPPLPFTKQSRLPTWRGESLRTTLWFVPTLLVAIAALAFGASYAIDRAAYEGAISLPGWIRGIDPGTARQELIGIAAAVITVAGVVFSITILALTLASQQFGPRMLRTFIRDLGTQVTLGAFVATFVYAVAALGAVHQTSHEVFVPYLSLALTEGLVLVDMAVLIYFIHHIAHSIQLPQVIAVIARDLSRAIDADFPLRLGEGPERPDTGAGIADLVEQVRSEGERVPATQSGYLQLVGYSELTRIAEELECVILLAHRPGHFIVCGHELATVWPRRAAPQVARALARSHVTGPHRTLTQDPVFAIDQLVEIAIRALSPAVNDTFTALTCIDWLSDGLSKVSGRQLREGVYRDRAGSPRLIAAGPSYARMVNRAFDKVRQAGRGMPAVALRQLEAVQRVLEVTEDPERRRVLVRQADMILRGSEEAIPEEEDRALVRARYADALSARPRPGVIPAEP
jgi:uncharacterized membrane protein